MRLSSVVRMLLLISLPAATAQCTKPPSFCNNGATTCDTNTSSSHQCNYVSYGCCCSGAYAGSLCAECATGACTPSSGNMNAPQGTIICSYDLCGCSCDSVSPSDLACITEAEAQRFIDLQGGCQALKNQIGGSCADAGPAIIASQRQLGYTAISATCSDSKEKAPIGIIVGAVGLVASVLLLTGLGVHFSRKKPSGDVQITGGAADPVADSGQTSLRASMLSHASPAPIREVMLAEPPTTSNASPLSSSDAQSKPIADRLEQLEQLQQRGLLSDAEYAAKREELLGAL